MAAVTCHTWLRRAFNWMVEKDELEASPIARMKPPAPVRVRERALSDDEVRRLWVACDERPHPFGRYMQLLLLTACRRMELATLMWSDVDSRREDDHHPGLAVQNWQAASHSAEPPGGDAAGVAAATRRVCVHRTWWRDARVPYAEGEDRRADRSAVRLRPFTICGERSAPASPACGSPRVPLNAASATRLAASNGTTTCMVIAMRRRRCSSGATTSPGWSRATARSTT